MRRKEGKNGREGRKVRDGRKKEGRCEGRGREGGGERKTERRILETGSGVTQATHFLLANSGPSTMRHVVYL